MVRKSSTRRSYETFAMSCKFYYKGKDKLCVTRRKESTKKHTLSNDDSFI